MQNRREFGAVARKAIEILCACLSIPFLYQAYSGRLNVIILTAVFVIPTTVFAILNKPPVSGRSDSGSLFKMDCALAALGALSLGYLAWTQPQIFVTKWTLGTHDYIAIIIATITIMEATRRTIGLIVPIITILAMLYTLFGYLIPGVLGHPGFGLATTLDYIGFSADGIWGITSRVMAGIVVIFIIFSSFLNVGGGSTFFLDLPLSLFGRYRGGAAKAAVIGSGLFGMITGSVVANVAAIGTFTIPLMKKTGYRPEMAGAIEAVASTGGQLMPPVMGAAAFVMAEILQISYWSICVAAFIPAVLYYVSLFMQIHLKALKGGLGGLPNSQLPDFKKTLLWGWPLIFPLVLLVFLLGVLKWSAQISCFYTLISLILISMPFKSMRIGPTQIYQALHKSWPSLITLGPISACIGIVVGCINLTGVGLAISSFMIEISHGNLLVLSLITMIVALILGMAIPTTACYLFLAPLLAPALHQYGVPLLAAHLFVFYGGLLSAVTPPNAVGAFAAAPIAGADVMKVGWSAARLAIIAYIIPFLWVFNPSLLLIGTWDQLVIDIPAALVGAVSLSIALEGWLFTKIKVWLRLIFVVGFVTMVIPMWQIHLSGLGIIALGFMLNRRVMSNTLSKAR